MEPTQKQLLGPIDLIIPEKRRFLPNGDPRPKAAFDYSAPFNGPDVLPAGLSTTVGIPIDSGADFIALQATIIATLTNDVTVVGFLPATILLVVSTGKNQFMDQPVHVESFRGGSGGDAVVLPWPIFLSAGTNFNITLANLDPANAYNVWVKFSGVQVF